MSTGQVEQPFSHFRDRPSPRSRMERSRPGRARATVAPHELVRLWTTQPGIVLWAPGTRNLWIGISI
jgi:hypothetical protein